MSEFLPSVDSASLYSSLHGSFDAYLAKRAEQELFDTINGLGQFISRFGYRIVASPQDVGGRDVYIHGRVKTPARVKQKMELKGYSDVKQVYDLLGIEVISEYQDILIAELFTEQQGEKFKKTADLFSGITVVKGYRHINEAGYEAIFTQAVNERGTPIEIRFVRKYIWQQTQEETSPTHHSRHLQTRYGAISS